MLSSFEDDSKSLIRFDSEELTEVLLVRWDYCVTSAEKHLNLDFWFVNSKDPWYVTLHRLAFTKTDNIIYKTN